MIPINKLSNRVANGIADIDLEKEIKKNHHLYTSDRKLINIENSVEVVSLETENWMYFYTTMQLVHARKSKTEIIEIEDNNDYMGNTYNINDEIPKQIQIITENHNIEFCGWYLWNLQTERYHIYKDITGNIFKVNKNSLVTVVETQYVQ